MIDMLDHVVGKYDLVCFQQAAAHAAHDKRIGNAQIQLSQNADDPRKQVRDGFAEDKQFHAAAALVGPDLDDRGVLVGVLDDEPVEVLFIEFGNSGRKVRIRWWIATFHDKWQALDRGNAALESAFEKAGIEIPYETYDLRVHMENGGDILSRPKPSALGEDPKDDRS